MAWIREILPEDAEGELDEVYGRVAEPDGTVDNILRVHGLHPKLLADHFQLYITAMKKSSPLSRAQREMIAVVVSSLNECHY
ncbi:MAG: peroxidase [Acidobacteria bacterium]|jgi:alkylhydroperoxidase family enzyme|nr:peroxidase [Acidobacteriota bacterium]|tara:strand:+ start:409 stop:654 length:246 start_codon:yes stop_codon:yes gene_type:complete